MKNLLILIKIYYRIYRLPTGFQTNNKFFLFLIILIGLTSIFFRIEVYPLSPNFTSTLCLLLYVAFTNMIFIKFNIVLRIFSILDKGIPFFIKSKKYFSFLSYLILNSILIIFSLLLLLRFYLFLYEYNKEILSCYFLYTSVFALILFNIYFVFKYEQISYDSIDNKAINLNFFLVLLLSALPLALLLNAVPYLSDGIKNYVTIHCQPNDDSFEGQWNNIGPESRVTVSNNVQGNSNTQASLEKQSNSTERKRVSWLDAYPAIALFSDIRQDKHYYDLVRAGVEGNLNKNLFEEPLGVNIQYLSELERSRTLPANFITVRLRRILMELFYQSPISEAQFVHNKETFNGCGDLSILSRLSGVPVYFNKRYQIGQLFIDQMGVLSWGVEYSTTEPTFSIFSLYKEIGINVTNPSIRDNLLRNITVTLQNSCNSRLEAMELKDLLLRNSKRLSFSNEIALVYMKPVQVISVCDITHISNYPIDLQDFYFFDSIHQLCDFNLYLRNYIHHNWSNVLTHKDVVSIIDSHPQLYREFARTHTLELNSKNLDLLYARNRFSPNSPDKDQISIDLIQIKKHYHFTNLISECIMNRRV